MKLGVPKNRTIPEGTEVFIPILASDAGDFDLWHCHRCHIVFERDDTILRRISNGQQSWFACPLRKKRTVIADFLAKESVSWFLKRNRDVQVKWTGTDTIIDTCAERLQGWDEDFFLKEYDMPEMK